MKKSLLTWTLLLLPLLSTTALAASEINSLCYQPDQPNAHTEGVNTAHRFELASVSKVITAFWALDAQKPDFRFTTTIDVTPVDKDSFDVHLTGVWDPYFGREMTHFMMSELYRLNVRKIRNLTFDENFSIFWSVREKPTWSINPTPADVALVLRQKLRMLPQEYNSTRAKAKKIGIQMSENPRISISKIQPLEYSKRVVKDNTRVFFMRSAPLYRYIKEMNRNSNNHVADRLFEFLGGSNKFVPYIKQRLNLSPDDIRLVNGSGDKVFIGHEKVYNEGSCEAIVHIISETRTLLQKYNYDLKDIMAVAGTDQNSTLGERYAGNATAGSMIAKTGTIDPAITLAGLINTEQGPVYFGILYKTKGPKDWANARDKIRKDVVQLMGKFGGKSEIEDYTSNSFLPFDEVSTFVESPNNLRKP